MWRSGKVSSGAKRDEIGFSDAKLRVRHGVRRARGTTKSLTPADHRRADMVVEDEEEMEG